MERNQELGSQWLRAGETEAKGQLWPVFLPLLPSQGHTEWLSGQVLRMRGSSFTPAERLLFVFHNRAPHRP